MRLLPPYRHCEAPSLNFPRVRFHPHWVDGRPRKQQRQAPSGTTARRITGVAAISLVLFPACSDAFRITSTPLRPNDHAVSSTTRPISIMDSCRNPRSPVVESSSLWVKSRASAVLRGRLFDDDDDDDDEEDEEEDDEEDSLDMAAFRARMDSLFAVDDEDDSPSAAVDDLIAQATQQQQQEKDPLWVVPVPYDNDKKEPLDLGTVLVANPAAFLPDQADATTPKPNKFSSFFSGDKDPNQLFRQRVVRYGLAVPPPIDMGPDRRADLLPVLLLVERNRAVMLNRRTGHLLGDLRQNDDNDDSDEGQPLLAKFCIQPLWFGGLDSSLTKNSAAGGLNMLHRCPDVPGATLLRNTKQKNDDDETEIDAQDCLYWGGDVLRAGNALDARQEKAAKHQLRTVTGFDFKFFVQCTQFRSGELENDLVGLPPLSLTTATTTTTTTKDDSNNTSVPTFFAVRVATELLFQTRDRVGTRRAKPLWTDIMERLGGDYTKVRNRLYNEEDDDSNEEAQQAWGELE